MDEIMLKNIKAYLEHETGGVYDDEEALFNKGKENLEAVLQKNKGIFSEQDYKEMSGEISRFISEDEACERKIYNYCLDIKDTSPEEGANDFDGAVEQHRLLSKNELLLLCNFVKSHKKDKTVGMVINQMMYDRNLTAPQVYDAAMLSRQDFSRIVNTNKGVSKSKIWSLIIGLHCDLDEADNLLQSAGYYRKDTPTDLIMVYFIKKKNYDIIAINEVLYALGLKLLSVHKEVRDKDSGPDKKNN